MSSDTSNKRQKKTVILIYDWYNKQNKGVWGMPRLSEAMKGVISCEKLRGRAHTD
jgi:hypothetical protein